MARPKRHREDAASLDAAVDAADEIAAAPEIREASAPAPTPAPPVAEATPSMAQFLEIKTANPDSILWYRMGDFYELFFDDAVVASQALGIVLTKRGKHLGQDIPMCGVPVHRADEYLQRLIRLGYRVAVCEQLEDPAEARKRGAKAVVRRDVVRLVTPGTLTEETLLDARARNYLTALFRAPGGEGPLIGSDAVVALASLDISTGEFEVGEARGKDLPGELVRLAASEIIVADAVIAEADLKAWIERSGAAATPVPAASFDSLAGERDLKARLGVADLGAFGAFTRAELAAVGALLRYVDLTQIGKKPVVRPPRRLGTEATLVIDAASRASLELVRSTSGEKAGSLLDAIDRTVTGAGSRELAARLATPLTDPRTIEARLDAVAMLVDDEPLREALRETLKGAPDLARAVSRLAFGRGGPRDLAGIAQGLAAAAEAARHLRGKSTSAIGLPDEIARLLSRIDGHGAELLALLSAALVDDPPHLRRDGGFVRRGFRPALDEAHALRDDSRRVMAELEARYVEETGIKTLKVRHNNILGYFIEVTQTNAKPLTEPPLSDTFRHRQSMANAMRFITPELSETEGRIASAADRALAIEQEIFNELASAVAREERALSDIAAALAELDHTAALAHLAHHERFVRPVVDNSLAFEIRGGRHPVVEQALHRARGGPFVANDCILGRSGAERPSAADEMPDARIWLVTGPNMAGKSTFLRENALIAILAQMGSFVPAAEAHIGVVDRLFSRVGAADDLARGRSTFMVEMVETAAILNQATARSLVILDEIGRGTATFDGLSIAWAAVEFLHEETEARVLFATHYHELTALAGRLASVANVTMDVKEWRDDIVFLHRVKAGAADRSYGIQVAKLAGLPAPVIARAREVLNLLEKADRRRGQASGPLEELPLFAAARPASAPEPSGPSAVEVALDAMNPDDLSPKAALEALYGLKRLRAGGPAK
jgi:DNA mismatch repair protein MutS